MKRYLLLTSVLALAACGAGTGGGGMGSAGEHPRASMTTSAITSNKEITNMAAEILVADGEETVVQRSALTTHTNGKNYTSYRLDDVKFFTAENLSDETNPSFLKMELDRNGKINAIHMDVGGVASGRTVRDTTDTTLFQGPIFEYVPNGSSDALYRVVDNGSLTMDDLNDLASKNNLKNGHWNRIDERLDIKTYGKKIGTDGISGDDIKLTYSDFGHFNPVYKTKYKVISSDEDIAIARAGIVNRSDDNIRTTEEFNNALQKEDYQLFAGGYAIKNGEIVDSLDPAIGTYKGKAVGRVYTSIETKKDGVDKTSYLLAYGVPYDASSDPENHPDYKDAYSNDAGHDIPKAYTTSAATLTVNANAAGDKILEELNMPFYSNSDTADKFYNVTIKTKDGNITAVKFAADDESVIDAQYRIDHRFIIPDPEEHPEKKEYIDAFKADKEANTYSLQNTGIASFNPGYYGIDTPTEAAGTLQFRTTTVLDEGDQMTRKYDFQAAYGMQKQ